MPDITSTKSPSNKRNRTIRWLLEGLAIMLLLFLVHLWQTRYTLEGTAPSLEGLLLDGQRFSLQNHSAKPKLVYFWANWCPVCSLTSESVDDLAKKHEVITIAMQSGEAAQVEQYLEKNELSFPVITDVDGEIARAWGVHGVPTLYFLDGENRISNVTVGYTSMPGMTFRLWMAE
jgi:peroxiredoxin